MKEAEQMKRMRWFAVGVLYAACAVILLAGCTTVKEPSYTTLIAHRGESVDAPENTLPSYRMAVERGFGFECDIYLSKDGRCFTFHDDDLSRTTDGACKLKCGEASWDEQISKLDVGSWGKWKGSRFAGTRPALLEEVLALARSGREIYVEVKTGPEILPAIREAFEKVPDATPDRVRFISFNRKTCAELKRQMPQFRVYLLDVGIKWGRDPATGRRIPSGPRSADELIAELRECGADGLDVGFHPQYHDAAFVKRIKDAGFSFHVWTVDDLGTAKKAFAVGADTLTTNCAKKILDEYEGERAGK